MQVRHHNKAALAAALPTYRPHTTHYSAITEAIRVVVFQIRKVQKKNSR